MITATFAGNLKPTYLRPDREQLIHFYHILVAIDPEIRPSDNTCPVFKDYALTCVSQSNSKDAREERLKILEDILFSA